MDSFLVLPIEDNIHHIRKHSAKDIDGITPMLEPLEGTSDEDDIFFAPSLSPKDVHSEFNMTFSQNPTRSEESALSSEYGNVDSHGPHSMLTDPITNQFTPSSAHSHGPHSMLTEPITNKFETSNPPAVCSVSSASSSSVSYVTSGASTTLSDLLGLKALPANKASSIPLGVREAPPSPQERRYRPPQGSREIFRVASKDKKDTDDAAAQTTKEILQIQDQGDGVQRHRSIRSLKPFDEPEMGWNPPPCEPVTLFRELSNLSLNTNDESPNGPTRNEMELRFPDRYSPSVFDTKPIEPEREPENIAKSRGIGMQVEGFLSNFMATSPPEVVEFPSDFLESSSAKETESARMKSSRSDVSSLQGFQEARDNYQNLGFAHVVKVVELKRSNSVEQPPRNQEKTNAPKPSKTRFVASLMSCTSPNLRDAVACSDENGTFLDKSKVFACHHQQDDGTDAAAYDADDAIAYSIDAVKKQWTKIASGLNEKISESNKEKLKSSLSCGGTAVWNNSCSCGNRNVLDSTLDGGDQQDQSTATPPGKRSKTTKVRFNEPPKTAEWKIKHKNRKGAVARAALDKAQGGRDHPSNSPIKNLVSATRVSRESAHVAVSQISEFLEQSSKAIMETPKKVFNCGRQQDPPPKVPKQSYHVAARLEMMKKWQQETE